jgi:hypothetical protein
VLTDYLMVRVSRFVHNRDQPQEKHTRLDYRSWVYEQRLEGYKRGRQVRLQTFLSGFFSFDALCAFISTRFSMHD